MSSIYNGFDTFHKAPSGAVRAGQAVTFTLRVPGEFGCTTPYLALHRDGEEPSLLALHAVSGGQGGAHMPDGQALFTITVPMPQPGLYFYYFDLYTGYRKLYRGALGEAYVTTGTGEEYQLTVYEAGFSTPSALKGGVMYQIFPDRFLEGRPKPMPFADRIYRENKSGEPYFWPTEQVDGYLTRDYFGGDFEGIRRKLPYLAGLGVTMLYLNPIFEAHSNHRYNTANYLKADPLLGTNEEFARLCAEAKQQGISIILDGVFSHTGSDSIYFNRECRYPVCGACNSPDSRSVGGRHHQIQLRRATRLSFGQGAGRCNELSLPQRCAGIPARRQRAQRRRFYSAHLRKLPCARAACADEFYLYTRHRARHHRPCGRELRGERPLLAKRPPPFSGTV